MPQETFVLSPTPITSQPTLYIQVSWADHPYGQGKVSAQAAHNGKLIFFRLSWPDETKNDSLPENDSFADACAVLFPVRPDATLTTMGSPAQPVNGWFWRADLEAPIHITATGTGTTVRHTDGGVGAAGQYGDGGWTVVLWRSLGSDVLDYVDLGAGKQWKCAFGVWQGANRERAGLKGVTLEWQSLDIEA